MPDNNVRRIKKYVPGTKQVSAADLNTLAAGYERLNNIRGVGGIEVNHHANTINIRLSESITNIKRIRLNLDEYLVPQFAAVNYDSSQESESTQDQYTYAEGREVQWVQNELESTSDVLQIHDPQQIYIVLPNEIVYAIKPVDTLEGRWEVLSAYDGPRLCKALEDIPVGEFGKVSIYEGSPGSEDDTGIEVKAFNYLVDIDDDLNKFLWLRRTPNGFYIAPAECF